MQKLLDILGLDYRLYYATYLTKSMGYIYKNYEIYSEKIWDILIKNYRIYLAKVKVNL